MCESGRYESTQSCALPLTSFCAASFVDVPDALFADPAYEALRRAYGKVADIVGLPPYTLVHGKKHSQAETSVELRPAAPAPH